MRLIYLQLGALLLGKRRTSRWSKLTVAISTTAVVGRCRPPSLFFRLCMRSLPLCSLPPPCPLDIHPNPRLSAAVVTPSHHGPSTQLSEVATAHVDVLLQQEFVPSYEWQRVYPWQSVPPGLEVQLPLDGTGQKRARVPPSWRLQLYIPEEEDGGEGGKGGGKSGGFFVRTDLRANSTVLEVRREIASQPRFGLPLESVTLLLGGRVLGDEETAEGLDLFNRQRDLTPLVDRSRSPRPEVL